MLVYGATMFLSAFLLFLVQPMTGRFILPWFGGAPAVWTTCMLFFQALLLAGYAYAHGIATNLPLRRQARLHVALLVASSVAVLWFSVAPSPAWKPVAGESPVERILGLLLVSIGAPFLLLSATAPLLQSWFSRTRPERFPYKLYAVSNLGSLLAILSYPFLIEPSIALRRQATIWSWTYMVFALACGLVAWKVMSAEAIEPVGDSEMEPRTLDKPGAASHFLWLALTACSSIMLLATTSMMSQDLAVVPLLWILPLSLYLLSFVMCFQHERLYWRPLFLIGLVASIAWMTFVLKGSVFTPLRTQIVCYSLTLFMVCMVCHGELVRLRPASKYLTSFYLMVAGGGALGGFLVTVIAPRVFQGFWEYHFGLLATTLLVIWIVFRDGAVSGRRRPAQAWAAVGVLSVLWVSLAFVLGRNVRESTERNVEMARNFFGVLKVQELYTTDPEQHQFSLVHGRIEHGYQFVDPMKRHWPVSYYGPTSGMGTAMLLHPNRTHQMSMRIGVIGLGAGIASVYGAPGDIIRFYEINPDVVRLSDKYFTYRKDSRARNDVTLGDARVTLERLRAANESQQFDVLVVDAFSSDAIPVHLLTREAFDTFRFHMKRDGILAFHVTSRYFDLKPVLRNLVVPGPNPQTQAVWFNDLANPDHATDRTDWVLLTNNQLFLNNPEVRARITPWPDAVPRPVKWTDDYSNLVSVIYERDRGKD
ncbi:MAG TPA: fused MFS/spermidine synthase [Vicinamibacterales bacterium]|nr:fused MFS/spermidine synthase [Vicinamibacterales bacterium]